MSVEEKPMKKVLVTGFAPFGAETVNPSYEAVKLLPDRILDAAIVKAEIPVVFGQCGQVLAQLMAAEHPDLVLLVGQAGGRSAMEVERVAINCQDCPPDYPDNAGAAPVDAAIVPGGPAAYFATLPIKAMVARMLSQDIPARISNSAGTYVCNDLMYRLLHLLATAYPGVKGGFLHVPYATSQRHPALPSMPLGEIARGLQCAIEAMLLPPEP